MSQTNGFELIREQHIAELNTRARLYRHIQTGAELLSLENDDENKVFGITFRTPPNDSTGVPHIMEHSVGARSMLVSNRTLSALSSTTKIFILFLFILVR